MLFQIVVRHMLQYVWLLMSHTTWLPDIYDGFSAGCLRWECRSRRQLCCLVCDKKKLPWLNQFYVIMLFQSVVTHMLQYVWLLMSHTTWLPDIYDGFSAGCLRWECRSRRQLCCLVCDKKKLPWLNQIDVIMLFQIVVTHMLQYVWLLMSHTTLLPVIYVGF